MQTFYILSSFPNYHQLLQSPYKVAIFVSSCLRDASDDFLLRFLRMQKMNVNKSISVMENYLGFRTNRSGHYLNYILLTFNNQEYL